MSSRPPTLGAILTAVMFALSCFGFTLFVWNSFGGTLPFRAKGYRIHVVFGADAAQLNPNADVRISGVSVGKVVEVVRTQEGLDAVIQVESKFAPLPADIRATTRTKTLLGETFVELSPGNASGPALKENEYLKADRVIPAQSLDKVLNAFDRPTRNALKRFLQDFSVALKGRGPDLNAALGTLGPTSDDLRVLSTVLDSQRVDLRAFLNDTGEALEAAAARPEMLQELIRAGNTVFSSTASRDRQLTATLNELPGFLEELRQTFRLVRSSTTDLQPALDTLRPVIPLIRPALVETSRLAPDLKAVFEDLPPVIRAADRGLPALTRILGDARPAMKALYDAGRQLVPVVDALGAYKTEIVTSLSNAAASTQASFERPGLKPLHYLRAMGPIWNDSIAGIQGRYGSNRHNPYFRPGGLDDLATGLAAFSCANAGNPNVVPPLLGSPPACKTQAPWTFRGDTRAFPHLEQTGP